MLCRCSMPLSLAKMPTAARQALSSLINLFSASTSDHHANGSANTSMLPAQTQIPATERLQQLSPLDVVNNQDYLLVSKWQNDFSQTNWGETKKAEPAANNPEPNRKESKLNVKGNMNGTATQIVNGDASGSPPSSSGASSDMDNWEPNVYEKELVKRTWSDDFDFLYELGTKIYQHIFDTNPFTKQLFPAIHRHGAEWKQSKEFRAQALKFVQTISQSVKNLYHMDRLAPFLYKIGERHVQFADRGFKPEYWDVFQDSIEYALCSHISSIADLSEQQKNDATNVWRTLALYIITHMKKGYFEALEKLQNGSK
ncbi:hypothetical protein L596_008305 [Steinernema carpocapsae]|uniref:Globin domain-containing protein n=1 Tax=Steinernema carpocapsae TaxID=34508 RepID=A0A4V6A6A0_STECR|nr:hypothetical protein L596_008305 [Steinernema carpocapsae]